MRLIYFKKPWKGQAGSALLGLIVTMVFLSALAAAMIAQTTTGSLGFVNENSSLRAYYLAESGFRYAAAKLKNSGESALNTLHNHEPYSIEDYGCFTIKFKTYIFDVDSDSVTNELVTKVPFGDASSLADASAKSPLESGQYFYVKTESGSPAKEVKSIVIQDSGGTPDPNGEYVKFIMDSGIWSVTEDTRVKLVVISNGDDVDAEGGKLNLQATSQVEAFPRYNGRFEAQGKTYSYKQRETDKLVGIYCVSDGGCSWPLSLPDGEEIILQDFTILHSIGTYVETSRKIVYNIPVSTSEKAEFYDTFEDKSHWEEVSTLGTHEIETIGDDSVLRVTRADSVGGADVGSLIKIDSSKVDAMLERSHASAGNFLSYDTQVKIGFDSLPDSYMAGISFRQDAEDSLGTSAGNSYGVSFLKGGSSDGIPDDLVPYNDRPIIILWQQTNSGTDRKWLAYKHLIGRPAYLDSERDGWNNWLAKKCINPSPCLIFDPLYYPPCVLSSYAGVLWHQESRNDRNGHTAQYWYYGYYDKVPGGNYNTGTEANCGVIESPSIVLPPGTSPFLSFWSWYETESGTIYDKKLVQISTDGGTSWITLDQLAPPDKSLSIWQHISIDLSDPVDYTGKTIKIRFRFDTCDCFNNALKGWYIDDVIVAEDFPINEATLMVRVKEAATLSFTGGGATPIEAGDIVYQATGRGTVLGTPILESGSWTLSNATGIILLNKVSGSFTAGQPLYVDGSALATTASVAGFYRARDNYIRVYYGDKYGYGTPGIDPLDYDKHGNPRGELNWPPDEVKDWAAANDYFTLVQWDEVEDVAVSFLDKISSLDEPDAILRTNELTTPINETFSDTEIGLHTFGVNSTKVYFDDFGLQTDVPTSEGFFPAVQQ